MVKTIIKAFFILLTLVAITLISRYYYSLHKSEQRIIEARKIDPAVWEQDYINQPIKDKYKIVIVTTDGGEWVAGQYLIKAAENLGWQAKMYSYSTQGHEKEILAFDPDIILCTIAIDFKHIDHDIINHRSKKYGMFYHPINTKMINVYAADTSILPEYFFDANLMPNAAIQKMINFSDGILATAKELKIIEDYYELKHKKFYGMRVVPSVPKTNYAPADPKYLTIIGQMWDQYRSSNKFKNVLSKLDKTKILRAYGKKKDYWFIPHSYNGYIKGTTDALLNTIHQNGIALIIHSNYHRDNATSTSRIMEAVAANVLVISDKNPFIVEHFGDNVLYFDTDTDANNASKQIKDHYDWAVANPDQAKAMADRAHQIFLEKFTSEQSLIRIAKMHEKILADEKIQNLEFPAKW